MRFLSGCLRPYIEFGDVSQCHLPTDHRGTCEEANKAQRLLGSIAFVYWLAGNGEI